MTLHKVKIEQGDDVRLSARTEQPKTIKSKLRAISEASKHEFPTADIEDMLREIDSGHRAS